MDDFDAIWDAGMSFSMGGSVGTVSDFLDDFLSGGGYQAIDDSYWMGGAGGLQINQNSPNNSDIENSWTSGSLTSSGGGDESLWDRGMGALNAVGQWADQNRTLAGLLGAGALNALRGNGTDMAAATLAKEQVDLRTRQRVSDSITGMRPMQVAQPGGLLRMTGQQVFDEQGRVVR